MGLRGMLWSAVAIVVGAIMYLALTAHSSSIGLPQDLRLWQVGVILMIAGGVGFLASVAILGMSLASSGRSGRTMDSQTFGPQGSSTSVHEGQRRVEFP